MFLSTPVFSIQSVQTRVQAKALVPWMVVATPALNTLVQYSSSQSSGEMFYAVTINSDLEWHTVLHRNNLNNEIFSVSRPYSSLSDLTSLLQSLDSSRVCIRSNDDKHATMLH